jgi:hypothetical protein
LFSAEDLNGFWKINQRIYCFPSYAQNYISIICGGLQFIEDKRIFDGLLFNVFDELVL